MRRRRFLLYAALALAVPVPAFALGLTGSGSSAAGSLDARASLDSCGLFEQQIVCKIDVSFNQIAGAERYAASVTAPDGSVSDYGDVGGGGASLWVPYVGDGTYTVTVQAWGEPPARDGHERLLSTDKASASGRSAARDAGASTGHLHAAPTTASPPSRGGAGDFQAAPGGNDATQSEAPPSDTTTTPAPPACVPPTPPAPSADAGPPASGSDPSSSASGSAATLGGGDAAEPQSQAQVPDSVTQPQCPDGTQPTGGDCCPAPTAP